MERRLTMASTPIIRYYDHLRLVYEVQSRMRELRRDSDQQQQQNTAPQSAPGESKQSTPHKDGGSRVDPPQQSGVPASGGNPDYLETSLTSPRRPARSLGSAEAQRERSTLWIA